MNDLENQLRRALKPEEPITNLEARVLARLPPAESHFSYRTKCWSAVRQYGRMDRAGWSVSRLTGSPRLANETLTGSGKIFEGAWLETDEASSAKIEVGCIGQVEIAAGSRVRLVAARLRHHRLALERGRIRATIWAPPRLFFVETPTATAVDLGCAYTLSVEDTGASLLYVSSGWVSMTLGGKDSLVPAGSLCRTLAGKGPGAPYFEDSSLSLRAALAVFECEDESSIRRSEALSVIVSEARERDSLTLWHLLPRTVAEDRRRVFSRLAILAPLPKGVTREQALRLDATALRRWGRQLELLWSDEPAWRRAWRRLFVGSTQ